jgi:hypothetical protein
MLLFGNILIDTGSIAASVLIIPAFLPFIAKPQVAVVAIHHSAFIIYHSSLPSPFRLPSSALKIPT